MMNKYLYRGMVTLALPAYAFICTLCNGPIKYSEAKSVNAYARNHYKSELCKDPAYTDEQYNYNENDLKKFNNWIEQTLEESDKNKKNAIIINKSEYTLYLIINGKVNSEYPVELGYNPYIDKMAENDCCTPEGIYKVVAKLNKNQTVFNKAFLLDYPNEDDKYIGKTGSAIEIHGSGSGKAGDKGGYNWTFGSIALSDKNIGIIFPFINCGDRITIVRYTNRISEIKNKR